MHRIRVLLSLAVLVLSSCADDGYTSKAYLEKVLTNLEKIESATYVEKAESWNPGDTAAANVVHRYVESYRNPSDTTIGSSWAVFESEQKAHLAFAYDGKMRALIYDDEKGVVIDRFKVRKLPFRPVSPPFFNYTENIIRYILENKDSTGLEQRDLGEEIYVKLTIYEDRQVEFFGSAQYIPKSLYIYDPTSIYELWINKESNLPRRVRREMCHNISVNSVSDCAFNTLQLENFVASDYFPKGYEVRQYGEGGKRVRPNALLGRSAPEWTLQTDDNKVLSLSDLKSKVLMIQFTSVSCGPCRASIPFLKALSTEYNKEAFDFVAIECTSKNTNVLKGYKQRNDFDYTFLLSTKEVLNAYSITSFPVFFILDEKRTIVHVLNGYGSGSTDKEIRAWIKSIVE